MASCGNLRFSVRRLPGLEREGETMGGRMSASMGRSPFSHKSEGGCAARRAASAAAAAANSASCTSSSWR
eukprot:scaffold17189_cov28-Tisochrysis_lutea.AAC.2